jgi:EAL domain-containing protein (putative c-di-GMP-specific phosphodiesterase class I)
VLDAVESAPFSVDGVELRITASVGIAMPSSSDDHPEGLLREADAAMYRAKSQGRARYELFDEGMRSRATARAELGEELRAGLDANRLVVHYQAVVSLPTGRIVGAEALVRWQHPRRGLLLPSDFMDVAEDTGLIVPMGVVVLEQATAQLRLWQDAHGSGAPRLHINLSPRQLAAPSLVDTVAAVVAASGVDPALLCFEVTESALIGDASATARTLAALKELGVSLAIDDFGTGQSSLAHLRRFKVDLVKIDRSLIDGLGPDAEASAIVAAVVRLTHTLELQAVAEGVETEHQLDRLRALGCHLAQGFLFARPGPASELDALLHVGDPFPVFADLGS